MTSFQTKLRKSWLETRQTAKLYSGACRAQLGLSGTALLTTTLPHVFEIMGLVTLIPLLQSAHSGEAIGLHLKEIHLPNLSFHYHTWLLIMLAMFSLQMLINALKCWSCHRLAQNWVAQQRGSTFQNIMDRGLIDGLQLNKGKTVHLFIQDCERLGKGLVAFMHLWAAAIIFLFVGIGLCYWSWRLCAIMLPFAFVLYFVMKWSHRKVYLKNERCFERQRETSSFIMECLHNLTTIFSTRYERQQVQNFESLNSKLKKDEASKEGFYQSTLHLTRYAVFCTVCILLFVHQLLPQQHQMSTEEMISFILILSRLQPVASTFGMDLSNFSAGALAHQEIQTFLSKHENSKYSSAYSRHDQLKKNRQLEVNGSSAKIAELDFSAIAWQNLNVDYEQKKLSLQYPDGQLQGKQLHIITGPSGCGKSTFLHLLCGLITPQTGSVQIGGHNLQNIDSRTLAQNMALTPQEPEFFMMSLRENLCFGLNPMPTDRDIIDIAQICNCEDIIFQHQQGLDSPMLNLGKNLSGGQKKKLMILRAILRRPKLWFCDEPTASLDEPSALEIRSLLEQLSRNITTVVVTHDPLLIEQAHSQLSLK